MFNGIGKANNYKTLINSNAKENSTRIKIERTQSSNVGLDEENVSCNAITNEPGNKSQVAERNSPHHIPSTAEKDIVVETMHISHHSDKYMPGHKYAGVIIYQYDGKSEWRTANNTHCKSGYIVIQDADSEKVKKLKKKERVDVHEAVYKNAFGESKNKEVVGEGFTLSKDGKFKNKSKSFNNPKRSEYHDNRERMHELNEHCVKKIVEGWKNGECVRHRNFKVKELLEDYATKNTGPCCSCCYIFSKMFSRCLSLCSQEF